MALISFDEAYKKVLETCYTFKEETVSIKKAFGRVLAENIYADRDFPPFNRSTKDGIALIFRAVEQGRKAFEIKGTVTAGEKTYPFLEESECIEIMTGGVVPYEADVVVMYEEVQIHKGIANISKSVKPGQHIHLKGSDVKKGALLLKKNTKITAAEIGVLATVGKSEITVKKLPSVAVISTGSELIAIDEHPQTHEVRKSNSYTLYAALKNYGIEPLLLHLPDDEDIIRQRLQITIQEMDILLLSGGVSKGKFDYIPKILGQLGVKKLFHGVAQRPGKPFWFGQSTTNKSLVFSFPGNPVSTFANFHIYFTPWLSQSLGLDIIKIKGELTETITNSSSITQFLNVKTSLEDGILKVSLINTNSSGDLVSLARSDGFIKLAPREKPYELKELVPLVLYRFPA
ncbi:molybdopterin molybdotransferase MoeA [Eudoraea chungangensis]|uniref:molybdopterin molybdotransferase MoeA n=1 Tax=Eudoraea chungangensis TaxID=1481905 RepID=UPI0023EC7A06|nr:molybdopterin molybdotransferase MoeA [Eudoraea chungangensis]